MRTSKGKVWVFVGEVEFMAEVSGVEGLSQVAEVENNGVLVFAESFRQEGGGLEVVASETHLETLFERVAAILRYDLDQGHHLLWVNLTRQFHMHQEYLSPPLRLLLNLHLFVQGK